MHDRRPLLLGGVLLVLAVAGVGGAWALSQGDGIPGRAGAAPGPSSAVGPEGAPPDVAGTPIPIDHHDPIPMTVYLSPTCECCSDWVDHVAGYGFAVELEYRVEMTGVKREQGVWPQLASCHTALVNGYVFEGHVPGDVVRRFLAEAPAARGLAVPGMPIGSPGMEFGDVVEPYDVLSFSSNGQTEVYSSHGRE